MTSEERLKQIADMFGSASNQDGRAVFTGSSVCMPIELALRDVLDRLAKAESALATERAATSQAKADAESWRKALATERAAGERAEALLRATNEAIKMLDYLFCMSIDANDVTMWYEWGGVRYEKPMDLVSAVVASNLPAASGAKGGEG
jgi:hypothetical protein